MARPNGSMNMICFPVLNCLEDTFRNARGTFANARDLWACCTWVNFDDLCFWGNGHAVASQSAQGACNRRKQRS